MIRAAVCEIISSCRGCDTLVKLAALTLRHRLPAPAFLQHDQHQTKCVRALFGQHKILVMSKSIPVRSALPWLSCRRVALPVGAGMQSSLRPQAQLYRRPGGIEPLGLSAPTDLKSVPGTIRAQAGINFVNDAPFRGLEWPTYQSFGTDPAGHLSRKFNCVVCRLAFSSCRKSGVLIAIVQQLTRTLHY